MWVGSTCRCLAPLCWLLSTSVSNRDGFHPRVLQLNIVDNSMSPGERISGSFFSHSTGQVGSFILWAFAFLPCFHLHQAANCHCARLLQVLFTLKV